MNNRNTRRGAAVVEFALIAPIFILLVFGMIEFGRMVMVQQVLTNASREGARLAVLDGTTTSDVTTAVGNYLTNAAINSSQAVTTVSPDPPNTAAFGDPVTVTVTIAFADVTWLPVPIYLGDRQLAASSVMRRETTQ